MSKDSWISVDERLPENRGKMLLVWYKSSGSEPDWCGMAFYSRTEELWIKGDGNRANNIWGTVTHWMPLPDPPKEKP
jgi:hypothetical protein